MKSRNLILLIPLLFVGFPLWAQVPENNGQKSGRVIPTEKTRDRFLDLGVGGDYQKEERYRTVDQINSFIPPLYEPIFVGHGFVLPPGALRVGVRSSFFDIDGDDFFKNGDEDFVHEDQKIDRIRTDLDLLYGLDHNFTVALNIPYWVSRSRGTIHPAGVRTMDLQVEADSIELGDVSLFLKKKWWDQANHFFNFATVVGVSFPTGANNERFDLPLVFQNNQTGLPLPLGPSVAFPWDVGGPFTRFSDDGRLPSVLQPGTGAFGATAGIMGTRQFDRFRGALHAGAVYNYLGTADGVDPGDEVLFFASFVKPIYRENLSLELTFNGMYKENDSYSGSFTHPVAAPDGTFAGIATTPRPDFRRGTAAFFSPGLIWTPQPQFRFTASASIRLNEPDLGPWPGTVFQLGMSYTF